MLLWWQCLCQAVGEDVCRGGPFDSDRSVLNFLTQPMTMDINVTELGDDSGCRISECSYGLPVVALDVRGPRYLEVDGFEETTPPYLGVCGN